MFAHFYLCVTAFVFICSHHFLSLDVQVTLPEEGGPGFRAYEKLFYERAQQKFQTKLPHDATSIWGTIPPYPGTIVIGQRQPSAVELEAASSSFVALSGHVEGGDTQKIPDARNSDWQLQEAVSVSSSEENEPQSRAFNLGFWTPAKQRNQDEDTWDGSFAVFLCFGFIPFFRSSADALAVRIYLIESR